MSDFDQKEFQFSSPEDEVTLSDPPQPRDLGKLSIDVLQLSRRGKKWLGAHDIETLAQLVEADREKLISRQCLDNNVRKELHRELGYFWSGKKYKYILALNFLDRGVENVLSRREARSIPVKQLPLSSTLHSLLKKNNIVTVGQLFLQPELKWRNPRSMGNILVNEILIALSNFLSGGRK